MAGNIYKNHFINSYVDLSRDKIWCIGQNCNNYIVLKDMSTKIVRCDCGVEVCFICREQPHAPASCDQVKNSLNIKGKRMDQEIS